MTMKSDFKNGTGLTEHTYDYEKKYVEIDFAGDDQEQCYRNDASVLFFAANSYREAYLTIQRELEIRFEKRERPKHIEHLILPYLFSFRHYLELEMKALYAAITDSFPERGHSLIHIAGNLNEKIKQLEYKEMSGVFVISRQKFDEKKQDIVSRFEAVQKMVTEYCDLEPAVEYYRYIFELSKNDMVLRNQRVTLDFNRMKKLFHNISSNLLSICMTLREMNIYVYFTL